MNLFAKYLELEIPISEQDNYSNEAMFNSTRINTTSLHRVGINGNGDAAILIAIAESDYSQMRSPIVLEHVKLIWEVECLIKNPDNSTETGRYALIVCTSKNTELITLFFDVTTTVLIGLPTYPTRYEVSQAINSLVELFRTLSTAPRQSIQGLWAELFLIQQSIDIRYVVASWRRSDNDLHDFVTDDLRLEVKSSATGQRNHHFSLEQLSGTGNEVIVVASVLLKDSYNGESVVDLANKVRKRISSYPAILLTFESTLVTTIGSGWQDASTTKFDIGYAKETLQFFIAKDIPCVSPPIPPGVSSVRFVSDLSFASTSERAFLRSKGKLFSSMIRL